MPDYIYLLENRLSADQRHALTQLRTAARDAGTILFLTGDAVRDLTSGHAVSELEVAVHGNALKLKKTLERLDAKVWGEDDASRSLYMCFPGTVRVNVVSTHRVEFPKPGKPVYHWASIHEDLRRRDFTVNSMAISLNEGSYGLFMDPLNGAADVEMRTLRLVSNYGFIEDPALLIRAVRYRARLGWELDPRTQARYDSAKEEGAIEFITSHGRSQELEEIGYEEDGLKVLRALDEQGWMNFLFPAWTPAKADEHKLNALHELAVQLQLQGVHPDMSAAQMQLLTAKLPPRELSSLKRSLLRPGFVEEWNKLDSLASGFSKALLSKQNAKPSASYRLFMSYDPEAILWLGFTSKDKAVQERFNLFLKVWPEARQRIPRALMQEMRITPDLPKYAELIDKLFLELIDGHLTTPEEMRAFLEPYSPPAPPPQVTIKRARGRRAEPRFKEQEAEEQEVEEGLGDDDLGTMGADEEELDLDVLPKGAAAADDAGDEEDKEEDGEAAAAAPPKGGARKKGMKPAPTVKAPAPAAPAKPGKAAPAAAHKKPAPAPAAAKAGKLQAHPPVPAKAKPLAKKPAKPAAKAPAKKAAPAKAARPKPKPKPKPKPAVKPAKKAAKPAKKSAPKKHKHKKR